MVTLENFLEFDADVAHITNRNWYFIYMWDLIYVIYVLTALLQTIQCSLIQCNRSTHFYPCAHSTFQILLSKNWSNLESSRKLNYLSPIPDPKTVFFPKRMLFPRSPELSIRFPVLTLSVPCCLAQSCVVQFRRVSGFEIVRLTQSP